MLLGLPSVGKKEIQKYISEEYGFLKDKVKEDSQSVVVLSPEDCREFIREFGDRCIGIYINAHIDTMRKLCEGRPGFDATEFNRRLDADIPKFNVDFLNDCIDYHIHNRGKGLGELFVECDCLMEEIGIEYTE
jgi:hypothetical protein